jgi:hypothetical protein
LAAPGVASPPPSEAEDSVEFVEAVEGRRPRLLRVERGKRGGLI